MIGKSTPQELYLLRKETLYTKGFSRAIEGFSPEVRSYRLSAEMHRGCEAEDDFALTWTAKNVPQRLSRRRRSVFATAEACPSFKVSLSSAGGEARCNGPEGFRTFADQPSFMASGSQWTTVPFS